MSNPYVIETIADNPAGRFAPLPQLPVRSIRHNVDSLGMHSTVVLAPTYKTVAPNSENLIPASSVYYYDDQKPTYTPRYTPADAYFSDNLGVRSPSIQSAMQQEPITLTPSMFMKPLDPTAEKKLNVMYYITSAVGAGAVAVMVFASILVVSTMNSLIN